MSHTLGIDPGVHHLGLCLVRDEDSRIVYWGVVTIDDSSVHTFLASFRECLGTIITDDKTISSVRIERQPSKNIRLSKIMHYIQIVCAITYPDSSIETVPPSRRIKFCGRSARPRVRYILSTQEGLDSVHSGMVENHTVRMDWVVRRPTETR